MNQQNRHRNRGKEILNILREHGPLSIDVLHNMTQPKMKKKRLRESLDILRRKQYVVSRSVSRTKTFYQLSQWLNDRERAALFLGCEPNDLYQPLISRQDWIHHECCEYWIHVMRQACPTAKVFRAIDFETSSDARSVMLLKSRDRDLFPDFLLFFPKTNSTETTSVAVEIERSRKSELRLVEKLDKYANKSFIDGLIYVCDSNRLCETIRLLFNNKIAKKSLRIGHYSDNFFLFSDAMDPSQDPLSRLFNSQRENVAFVPWYQHLQSTKRNFRRNDKFN